MIRYLYFAEKNNGHPEVIKNLEAAGFSQITKISGEEKEPGPLGPYPDLVVYEHSDPTEKDLEKIRAAWPNTHMIVISRSKDAAWKAFELGIDDFIVAPIKRDRIISAIYRIKEIFLLRMGRLENANDQFFFIREKEALKKLKISSIFFIQALGDYVNIFSTTKKYTVHINLKTVYERLPKKNFLRVHRSFIVNLYRIDKVQQNTIYVNEYQVPVGEAFKKNLERRLNIIK